MKRRWKILIGGLVVLAALLAVNTAVIDSQTKRAEVTVADGEILELSTVDLQVVDRPPTDPGDGGPGRPIVLLHCYSCSLSWWDPMIEQLNRNHRVISLDLIGHGGSAKPAGGYSIPEQAAAAAEALNRLDVTGAVVAGHSLGGMVATALAERATELTSAVAIIATPATDDQSSLPALAQVAYVPVVGQAFWRVRFDAAVRSGYERAFAPGFDFEAAFDDPDRVIADNEAMTYTSFDSAPAEADEYLAEQSLASRLTARGARLLAVLGADDQIVDSKATAASFREVPGSEVKILEGVGHSPNVEAPAETAEALLALADSLPPADPSVIDPAQVDQAAGAGNTEQGGKKKQTSKRKAVGKKKAGPKKGKRGNNKSSKTGSKKGSGGKRKGGKKKNSR